MSRLLNKNRLLWAPPAAALILAVLFISIFTFNLFGLGKPQCITAASLFGEGFPYLNPYAFTAEDQQRDIVRHEKMEAAAKKTFITDISGFDLSDIGLGPATAYAAHPYFNIAQAEDPEPPPVQDTDEQTPIPAEMEKKEEESQGVVVPQFSIEDCVKQDRIVVGVHRRSALGFSLQMIILTIFFLMLFTPFIPGIIELYKPHDDDPLFVDLDYSKDPRYFGNSFRELLGQGLQDSGEINSMVSIMLSKEEVIEACDSKSVSEGENVPHILHVQEDLLVGDRAKLDKEASVLGSCDVGSNCRVRAIVCDGDLKLGRATEVIRWVDAEGNLLVEEKCKLGISATSNSILTLTKGVTFKRLFGKPVQTYSDDTGQEDETKPIFTPPADGPAKHPDKYKSIADVLHYARGNLRLEAGRVLEMDVVVRGNLRVGKGVVFNGSVKVYGRCVVDNDVTVVGNLISEGEVVLGKGCKVFGNLFCQDEVMLGEGCQIGQFDKIKSLIGKKAVTLSEDVIVYGYILTEGEGRVK